MLDSVAGSGLAWVDLAVLGVAILSLGIGIARGLVRELLSLVSWVLAAWFAWLYGDDLAVLLQSWVKSKHLSLITGSMAVFFGSLLALSIGGSLINRLFHATGLTGMNRLMGAVFGLARAMVVIVLILFAARFTLAPTQDWYNRSVLIPYLEPSVNWVMGQAADMFEDQSALRNAQPAAILKAVAPTKEQ